MPLAFRSQSHGTVAFGFFNIETDMLLLDRLFFFADDFCRAVMRVMPELQRTAQTSFMGYRIDDPMGIGDLHGAIRGTHLTGFIGETYRRFPFPALPEDFKQSPEGTRNRASIEAMVQRFGTEVRISLDWNPDDCRFFVCEYLFQKTDFAELVDYVWRGGYPRWKDEVRPPYVTAMAEMAGQRKDDGFWVPSGTDTPSVKGRPRLTER